MHPPKNIKTRKFRFLLDSAFANPGKFPKLNKKAKLVHSVINLGLPPTAEDKDIYQKAIEKNCIVLTINFDDFRKLVKSNTAGVIGIPSQQTNDEIDELVTEFIAGKDPNDFLGKATKI